MKFFLKQPKQATQPSRGVAVFFEQLESRDLFSVSAVVTHPTVVTSTPAVVVQFNKVPPNPCVPVDPCYPNDPCAPTDPCFFG
jgi:hypothetical protein